MSELIAAFILAGAIVFLIAFAWLNKRELIDDSLIGVVYWRDAMPVVPSGLVPTMVSGVFSSCDECYAARVSREGYVLTQGHSTNPGPM